MKKYVFILLANFSVNFLYGQVILKIDSVDFSRSSEGVIIHNETLWREPQMTQDSITPRIRIVATISNELKKPVFVSFYGYRAAPSTVDHAAFAIMCFDYQGETYYKYLGWKNPEGCSDGFDAYRYGTLLAPHEKKVIELWGYIPSTMEQRKNSQMSGRDILISGMYNLYIPTNGFPYPSSEKVDGGIIGDNREQWFSESLPTMKIGISYVLNHDRRSRKIRWLISDPIDLKKVVVTTNLGNLLE